MQYALPTKVLQGSADQLSDPFPVDGGMVQWAAKYTGQSNFIVDIVDGSGQVAGLDAGGIVNTIGAYTGSGALHLDKGNYSVKVQASGPWEIAIAQPRHAPSAALPQTWSAKGDGLVGPFRRKGGAKLAATHDGKANFMVDVLDEDGSVNALVGGTINTIGPYNGSTSVGPLGGTYYLRVQADGNWTITLTAT